MSTLCAARLWRSFVHAVVLSLGTAGVALGQTPAPQTLRVLGGLAGVNQFTRHEAPFWTEQLPRLSQGRYAAEIVSFDRAGIRGPEMLPMLKLGTVPFGTLLLSQVSPKDLELGAPDLAGLNPDAATLRRSVAAFRPHLQQVLRQRHGLELLALYTYPAQVLFCNRPIGNLDAIKGSRVRTSSPSQRDWVEALGGISVNTVFAEIVPSMQSGNIDCAITGTMSGNSIGLHEHSTHIHTQAVNWGLSVFVAHGATWKNLPPDLKTLLLTELPRLEATIWDESIRETEEGIACNAGAPGCKTGRPGKMTAVRATAADEARRRQILAQTVLPRWLERCGDGCAEVWNRTLGPATGVGAQPR
jgi:TRAP-type C4-dicarboxylate transport system substrate-binding protein